MLAGEVAECAEIVIPRPSTLPPPSTSLTCCCGRFPGSFSSGNATRGCELNVASRGSAHSCASHTRGGTVRPIRLVQGPDFVGRPQTFLSTPPAHPNQPPPGRPAADDMPSMQHTIPNSPSIALDDTSTTAKPLDRLPNHKPRAF